MQILSRCLIWGTDLKYAWPLWCMVGICCGFCTKFWPRFSIYGISVICLFSLWALVALSTLRKRIAFALLIIALNIFFIIGRYEAPQPELQSSIWRSLEYAYVSGRGKIVKIYASSWKIRVLLRLENGCLLWGESADKRLLDYQGKQLKFNGLLLPIAENTQGDKKANITHMVKLNDFKDVSPPKSCFIPEGSWANSYIQAKIASAFSHNSREIAAAMFLGRSDLLAEETKALFRDVGLSHMTAASGFHLSIMATMAMLVVAWSGRSRKWGACNAIILCAVYVYIVGYMASLLRAFIMATLALGALIIGRPVRLERTVCLAWSLMLLSCPTWIEDIGFQLSFGAIFGIICWASLWNRMLHFLPNFLRQSVGLTIAVNLFLLPLLINYFQKVPCASILANLLVVPALEAVFILTIPVLLLSSWPAVGQLLPLICDYLCRYSIAVAMWLRGQLPVYTCYPLSACQMIIFYLVLIIGRLFLWALTYKKGAEKSVYS